MAKHGTVRVVVSLDPTDRTLLEKMLLALSGEPTQASACSGCCPTCQGVGSFPAMGGTERKRHICWECRGTGHDRSH